MADEKRKSGKRSSQSRQLRGVATGVSAWFQVYDSSTGQFYFFNKKTKETAWGLPLRDSVDKKEVRPHARHGNDDWVVCVDAVSGRKFYQSEKLGKIQWSLPLLYRPTLGKLPYFREKRTSMASATKLGRSSMSKTSTRGELSTVAESRSPDAEAGEKALRPRMLKRQMSLATMIAHISIDAVLSENLCCSAFHRFLVSTHAEENLLFYASAEVFRKGSWKGMQVLGAAAAADDDVSAEDEAKLRARARQAAAAQVRAQAEAELAAADEDADADGDDYDDDDDDGAKELRAQLSETRASVRIGLNPRLSLRHEARVIYDKFIAPHAPMAVFVDGAEARRILAQIEAGDVGPDLFVAAQKMVQNNMEADMLPRFLRVALAEVPETVGSGVLAFTPDEVVRRALQRLATRAGAEPDEE